MSQIVSIQTLAEEDIVLTFAWYQEKRLGLGLDFIQAVDDTLAHIGLNPRGYEVIHGEVRRAVLRRFPYCVYFVLADTEVVVLAVLHTSRHPIQWPNRI